MLRHPVLTLKKVARLPSKDREEVMKVLRDSKMLKVLKQKIRNRRRQRERVTRSLELGSIRTNSNLNSMASVNNDWSNWVTLNGSDVAKAADTQYLGKVIGLSFKGDDQNKFSILSRTKRAVEEPVLKHVEVERGVKNGVV
jgi:hypothetical protein